MKPSTVFTASFSCCGKFKLFRPYNINIRNTLHSIKYSSGAQFMILSLFLVLEECSISFRNNSFFLFDHSAGLRTKYLYVLFIVN